MVALPVVLQSQHQADDRFLTNLHGPPNAVARWLGNPALINPVSQRPRCIAYIHFHHLHPGAAHEIGATTEHPRSLWPLQMLAGAERDQIRAAPDEITKVTDWRQRHSAINDEWQI